LCQYIHGYGTITYCQLYVPAMPGNQQMLRGYIHGYGTTIIGMLLCMPHCSLLILILILIQSSKRGKWNCHIHRKNRMLEHTYIYPICLRYFGLLGSMPHCSLLVLIPIFILSSKRAKWNCHLSFYNLRDQLLLSIYPWLQNHCLAINNSLLLVSKDWVMFPLPGIGQAGTYIFPQIFRPFGQNATVGI
jgi:hypothetical protein